MATNYDSDYDTDYDTDYDNVRPFTPPGGSEIARRHFGRGRATDSLKIHDLNELVR